MVQQSQQHYYYAIGKRKTSVAQVRLYTDSGANQVNGKPLEEFFPWDSWQQLIDQPMDVTGTHGQFRIVAKIRGGGSRKPGGRAATRNRAGASGRRSLSENATQEGGPAYPRRP